VKHFPKLYLTITILALAVSCDGGCGDNLLGPDASVDAEMPNVDLPPTADPDGVHPIPVDAAPDARCEGAYPDGGGAGHDKHPDHNHCH
jgi:hypothetical protein